MPGAQKRLGELNALMAADTFWNNREQAQKFIDESNSLRNKIEPLLKAEKQIEDFQVMVELGEAEPEAAQAKVQQELEADLAKFFKQLDALGTQVGPRVNVATDKSLVQFPDHHFLVGRRETMLHGCNLPESLENPLNVAWPNKFLCASIGSDLVVSSNSEIDQNGDVETLP